MTMSSATSRASYAGNGATVAFSFPYKFELAADLVVTLVPASGIGVVKAIPTHYSVSGAGADAGGTVTMVTAPAVGETLVVERTVAITQATDLSEQGSFSTAVHEEAWDKLTAICQQLERRIAALELALVTPRTAPTDYSAIGRMYVTTAGVLKICVTAGTPGTFVTVGAQT